MSAVAATSGISSAGSFGRRRDEPSDRRRHARGLPDELAVEVPARLRSGPDVAVVNLSKGGVLLETVSRVRPGSRVEVVLPVTAGLVTAAGQVVRAWVAAIDREEGVRYRVAVAFDREVEWQGGNTRE